MLSCTELALLSLFLFRCLEKFKTESGVGDDQIKKRKSGQTKPTKPNPPNQAYNTKPLNNNGINIHNLYWDIQAMLKSI